MRVLMMLLLCSLALPAAAAESLRVDGPAMLRPLIEQVALRWQVGQPDVSVHVEGNGSGAAYGAMVGKVQGIHIGLASRPPCLEDAIRMQGRVQSWPLGYDAVAFAVSRSLYAEGVRALSLRQLTDVYRGRITNWQQLGGPNRRIMVVDRIYSSGTRQVMAYHLLGHELARAKGAAMQVNDDRQALQIVAHSDQAIAAVSMSMRQRDAPFLDVMTRQGRVAVGSQSVIDGRYPLVRVLTVLMRGDEEAPPYARSFVDYLLSDPGQHVVEANGFVPANRPLGKPIDNTSYALRKQPKP